MAENGTPIAYSALGKGVPVVSSAGRQFGTVDFVVAIPEEDVFHGIVVVTGDGRRFVAAERIEQITTTQVRCALNDEQIAALPSPSSEVADARCSDEEPWFAPSPLAQVFGQVFGFRPRGRSIPLTWQGWVITIALVVLAVILSVVIPGHHP